MRISRSVESAVAMRAVVDARGQWVPVVVAMPAGRTQCMPVARRFSVLSRRILRSSAIRW